MKIGAVLRHFGYTAVALHGCLESEVQVITIFHFNLFLPSLMHVPHLILNSIVKLRIEEHVNSIEAFNLHSLDQTLGILIPHV